MIGYKTVLRNPSGKGYLSINRKLKDIDFLWELGITCTVSPRDGSNEHEDYLFCYATIEQATDYAISSVPDGEVVLLKCDVIGEIKDNSNKIWCTSIKPLEEIPIKRGGKKILLYIVQMNNVLVKKWQGMKTRLRHQLCM